MINDKYTFDKSKIMQGDCLEKMKLIPDGSIDMILADLPYGTTACKWDTIIPFEPLWQEYERIISKNGAIVLFGSEPFSSKLRFSNIKLWKYDWVWLKSKGSNFTHAKNMPIKFHEDICVFSKAPIGHKVQLGERRMTYNPQGLERVNMKWKRPKKYDSEHKLKRESHKLERIIEFTNYPKTPLKYNNSNNKQRGLHPTQKPTELFEYLIKTYTNEGDIVLDNVAGSGTTGEACINLNRDFILIEKELNYYEIIKTRIYKLLSSINIDIPNLIN